MRKGPPFLIERGGGRNKVLYNGKNPKWKAPLFSLKFSLFTCFLFSDFRREIILDLSSSGNYKQFYEIPFHLEKCIRVVLHCQDKNQGPNPPNYFLLPTCRKEVFLIKTSLLKISQIYGTYIRERRNPS